MIHRGRLLAPLVFIAFAGCAASHAGRTVGRGMVQVDVSLGGPLVTNLGGAIPIPNVPVGVRYGLHDRLDVFGHVNLLPLVTGGFLQLDSGVTWALVRHEGDRGPNLATSVGFLLMTDLRDGARVSPLVDLAGGYTVKWFTAFAGFDLAMDFWGGGVHWSPLAGVEFDLPRRVTLQLAWKWYTPAFDWYASSIRYLPEDPRAGAMGVLLGIKVNVDPSRYGKKREGGGS